MVSDQHRFLRSVSPGGAGTGRVWVLHGTGLRDLFFHDIYPGAVDLRRTIELWGLAWNGHGSDEPVVTVTLTRTGELDFAGNPDPDGAREAFDQMHQRRPLRFGRPRPRASERPTAQAADGATTPDPGTADDTEQRSEAAATATTAAIGPGQRLLNRMNQLDVAMRDPGGSRLLVVVEDLAGQIQDLVVRQDEQSAYGAGCILRDRWVPGIDQTRSLVVMLDLSNGVEDLLPQGTPGVHRREIQGPGQNEIAAALHRVSRRQHFPIRNLNAVAASLLDRGDLVSALGGVARVHSQGRAIDLGSVLDLPDANDEAVEAALADLDRLVGLADVKKRARDLVANARQRRDRLIAHGVHEDETMHLVFTGGPGTGKTTVASIFARLYHALGLLPTAAISTKTSAEIMSEFTGATRTNMQRVIDEADRGVLFIDEIQHFADKADTKAAEAMQALVPAAWNRRSSMVIIVAGYQQHLHAFLDMDEGMARRFPESGHVHFADYTVDELWEVLVRALDRSGFTVAPSAEPAVRQLLTARRARGDFGNAGGAGNLASELIARHDSSDDPQPGTISPADVPPVVVTRAELVDSARQSLAQLVGLDSIESTVLDIQTNLRWAAELGTPPPKLPGLIFAGPPGTGKTTVARLMADLLFGLGAIERNQLVELAATNLRGQYLGQTAPKVVEAFGRARGGVLFIDEAYGLQTSDRDDFGKDAITAMVQQQTLPANRGTVVILAGYSQPMDEFLERNPGLTRRFSWRVEFAGLSPAACVEVARGLVQRNGLSADDEVLARFGEAAALTQSVQGPNFGNAGWVESAFGTAFNRLKRRVLDAASPINQGTPLVLDDLVDLPTAVQ